MPASPRADHFQRLLNDSERTLQEAFPGAFGELYTQSAKAFRDLYAELRLYYRGANLHLEETLAEFWARLLERLFRQLHPQLLLPDDYLDCLGKQAEALRPFGEAPRELRLRATRAFVAARAFVQGLGVAGDVVRKVSQVRPWAPDGGRGGKGRACGWWGATAGGGGCAPQAAAGRGRGGCCPPHPAPGQLPSDPCSPLCATSPFNRGPWQVTPSPASVSSPAWWAVFPLFWEGV